MPRGLNIKGFGRRKSSGNVLDQEPRSPASPASSSFRVLERPDKQSLHGPTPSFEKINRPFSSSHEQLRGKSVDNLTAAPSRPTYPFRIRSDPRLNEYRGSGGTVHSGSSGHYDSSAASARHSSSSTPPSSIDHERDPDDEELFPVKPTAATSHSAAASNNHPMSRPGTSPAETAVPVPPSFSARAARAFSFGSRSQRAPTIKDVPPLPPVPPPHGNPNSPPRHYSPQRERAATASSYASTAIPPRTELSLDLGNDDFGGMFESLKKTSPAPHQTKFHRTDSEPLFPPNSQPRHTMSSSPNPSPADDAQSPYSWDGDLSKEALIADGTGSPNLNDMAQPVPPPTASIAQAILRTSSNAYSRVPDRHASPRLESSVEDLTMAARQDALAYPNRPAQLDDGDRWVKRVELRDSPGSGPSSPVTGKDAPVTRQATRTGRLKQTGTLRRGSLTPKDNMFDDESDSTTPRAARHGLKTVGEDSMFDTSPIGPASRAVRPGVQQQQSQQSGGMKKMTKAQFQMLQRRGDSSAEQSDEGEDVSGDEYDDDDDVVRAKQMATQRRRQEANMAVYRQQMKKVTGGGPTDLPNAPNNRPSLERASASASSLSLASSFHFGGIGGTPPADAVKSKPDETDDDDDIPLGILQAHGFPSSARPPTRMADSDMSHQRRTSVTGSVVGGGAGQGNLPPFARRLPVDPYFGASLVNHTARESLAMNGTPPQMYGPPTVAPPQIVQPPPQPQAPMSGHPGGLIGVIAGEERARAARRGSPNAANGFAPPASFPLPTNMPNQMSGVPPMTRAMSMGNLAPPQVYSPSGVPPMPMMPQMMMPPQMPLAMDPASQQMQQFMQMQMQLMQNILQMQQAQMGQPLGTSPQPQQPHSIDYLGAGAGQIQRPVSQGSFLSNMQGLGPGPQGRSMTMLNPPTGWNVPLNANQTRPNSALPGTYAPSMSGAVNFSGDGPGPGYTPSIAPSERSNVGMPNRYRPVTSGGEATSRTQSMTSSLTLQALQPTQPRASLNVPGMVPSDEQRPKSTIRIIDKLKGTAKTSPRPVEDDEDDGWAEMQKKREEKKKKGRLFRKDAGSVAEPPLSDLYQDFE